MRVGSSIYGFYEVAARVLWAFHTSKNRSKTTKYKVGAVGNFGGLGL